MSFSLLIVDDETIERGGIRHLVESEIPDITEIREASNGVEFIRLVEDSVPDVVIVDVDMPGLNGLEALALVKQKGFCGKIVMHTAHGKFQYAQEALNMSADAFLLKPVKRKELHDLLCRLIREMEDEHRERQESNKLRSIVRELMPIVRSDLIASIVSGDMDTGQSAAHLACVGKEFQGGQIMTIRLPDIFFLGSAAADAPDRAHILERLTALLDDGKTGFAGMVVSHKIPLLLFHENPSDEFRNRIWAIELADRLIKFLKEEFEIGVFIGIGSSSGDLASLSRSYQESLAALSYNGGERRVHHHADTRSDSDSFNASAVAVELVNNDWPEEPKAWFQKRFGFDVSLDRMKDRLLSVLFDYRGRVIIDEEAVDPAKIGNRVFFNRLDSVKSKDQLPVVFKELLDNITHEGAAFKDPGIHSGVDKARRFIQNKYMKIISLDIVAESVGISPYYLSHLFREEIGSTYIQFLTDYRISKAKEFIFEGRYSLSEVSVKCGYSNPMYFAKVYRKNTGEGLTEIRGICRIEQ